MTSQHWDRRYAEPEPPGEARGLAPGLAVDLGCREGRNAIWPAEQGWGVTAVEFSKAGLNTAGRVAIERGVHADLLTRKPSARAFDLAIVMYAHLPSDQRHEVLARSAAALAPGGTLIVSATTSGS